MTRARKRDAAVDFDFSGSVRTIEAWLKHHRVMGTDEHVKRQLEYAWEADRDLDALNNMVVVCHIEKQPLPDWALTGVLTILTEEKGGPTLFNKRPRGGWRLAARKQRDWYLWLRVQTLQGMPRDQFESQFGKKQNLPNIRDIVAAKLDMKYWNDDAMKQVCRQGASVSAATLEDICKEVNRRNRAGAIGKREGEKTRLTSPGEIK